MANSTIGGIVFGESRMLEMTNTKASAKEDAFCEEHFKTILMKEILMEGIW